MVCYTLGLPHDIGASPDQRKPVPRAALQGVLPEPIRCQREKRGFDDLYGIDLARNLPHLEQMVRRSALLDLGILDADRLIEVMHLVAAGTGDVRSNERMDATLTLIAWFERLEQRGTDRLLCSGGADGLPGQWQPGQREATIQLPSIQRQPGPRAGRARPDGRMKSRHERQ